MSEPTDTEQKLIDLLIEEFDAVLVEPDSEQPHEPPDAADRWEGW